MIFLGGKMKKYFSKLLEKARTDAQSPNLNISSHSRIHRNEDPMNNPIIPNNQPDSQSEKLKEQKNSEQRDLIVRSENTIYGLPIFSTQPKKNTEFVPSRP
jgi:hypothetical protein